MNHRRDTNSSAAKSPRSRDHSVIGPFPGVTTLRQDYRLGDDILAKVRAATREGSSTQTPMAGACIDSGLVKPQRLRYAGVWKPGREKLVVPDDIYSLTKGVIEFQGLERAGAIWHSIAKGRRPRKGDVYVARRGLVKNKGYEILAGLAPVGRRELLDNPSQLLLAKTSTFVVFEGQRIDPEAAIIVFSDGRRCTRSDPEFPLALRWAMTPELFKDPATS
jgi:hypothetical protein